jgi:hypothetical protein
VGNHLTRQVRGSASKSPMGLVIVGRIAKEQGMAKESETRGECEHEPKGGRPRPADHGRTGGMAPREKAPELTEPAHDAD